MFRDHQAALQMCRRDLDGRRASQVLQVESTASVRTAVYIFIAFILCEGMLRRFAPAFGNIILAVKFVAAPAIYLMLYRVKPHAFDLRLLPGTFRCFVAVGMVLTIAFLPQQTWARLVGILVNLEFVPLFFVGYVAFGDSQCFRRIVIFAAILSGAIGLLAMYQSTLSSSHWLVVSTTGDEAIQMGGGLIRVPASFQYCNTYGNFALLSTVVCLSALLLARTQKQVIVAICALVASAGGSILTGSRAAGFGIAMILFAFAFAYMSRPFNAQNRSRMWRAIGVVAFACCALYFLGLDTTQVGERISAAAEMRSLVGLGVDGQHSLADRIEYYLTRSTSSAFELSNGIGVGWGLYTVGTERFQDARIMRDRAEGGYASILVECGVVGLVLFVAFIVDAGRTALRDNSRYREIGAGLAAVLAFAHLPLYMLQVSVIAAPWWLLYGAYHGLIGSEARAARDHRQCRK